MPASDRAPAEARLPQGTVRYRDTGSGQPIVFVHGALVDGTLWRKVTPLLEGEFRCVAPDLPLGSHRVAMDEGADLSPPGLARLVADLLAELGIDDATLVGNDTGGAICQLVAVHHPERLARLVLTPCDAFEAFPPLAFKYLPLTAKLPGGVTVLSQSMRIKPMRGLPFAYGGLSKHGIPPEVIDGWLEGLLGDPAIRRDTTKVLRGMSKRHTLEAGKALRTFDRPTLIAWASEDPFFKLSYGQRLAATIPDSRLVEIPDARTFVSEDQPERLAEEISRFIEATGDSASAASSRQ